MAVSQRVSFNDETRDGLRLCPCDINRTNVKKVLQGKVVALTFGATCFLPPPSFFAFAMAAGEDRFTRLEAQYVKYSPSANLNAMLNASYYLVPFGTNDIGDQLRAPTNLMAGQVFRASSSPRETSIQSST